MDPGLEQSDEIVKAKRMLEKWKVKVDEANDMKAKLLLEKLEQDDAKSKARDDMFKAIKQQQQCVEEFTKAMIEKKIHFLKNQKVNQDLMDQQKNYKEELEFKIAEFTKVTQKLKFCAKIPDVKLKFSGKKNEEENGEEYEEDGQHVRGLYSITLRPNLLLNGGQTLVTFEEMKVASQILKMPMCSVPCGQSTLNVKPKDLAVGSSVKFTIQLDIHKKELMFSGVSSSMPEERIRDRLEMSFSRPSRGGGEVERVDYVHSTGIGKITFLSTSVAERLALIGEYCVDLEREVKLKVEPVFHYHLGKFQTYCGAPKRTILLNIIQDEEEDKVEDEEDILDYLEIFLQKPSNSGGEIECIKYISTDKSVLAFFEDI